MTTTALWGPAGSGKTRWIADYIDREGIDSALILTYAKSAAREITSRIDKPGVRIDTAHSYAARIVGGMWDRGIRDGFAATGWVDPKRQLLVGDSAPFVERARGNGCRKRDLITGLSRTRMQAGDWTSELEARRLMRKAGVVSPDDLVELALIGIDVDGSEQYDTIVIDEAQDASDDVWRLFDAIKCNRRIIAGDDAQGLYGFAGANVTEFRRRMESADQTTTLDRVYRSADPIVGHANTVRSSIDDVRQIQARGNGKWGTVEHFTSVVDCVERVSAIPPSASMMCLASRWTDVAMLSDAFGVPAERPDLRWGKPDLWAAEAAVRCALRRGVDETDVWVIARAAGLRADHFAHMSLSELDASNAIPGDAWWLRLCYAYDLETIATLLDTAGIRSDTIGEGPISNWSHDRVESTNDLKAATTVHQSKGREADAIVYIKRKHDKPVIEYVAASRARTGLFVIEEEA